MYFIESNVPFGNISIFMIFVWAATAAAGVYLLRGYRDRNPLRQRFVRQVGVFETAFAGTGLVFLALKYFNVPVLEWRLWSYLIALAWLAYTGYAAWFYTSRLPAIIAAASRAGRGQRPQMSRGARPPSGNARTYNTNGGASEPAAREPRPPATTTRREARRERKRRGR